MLGRKEEDATPFCQTPRIDNADSPMWNHCCALPPPGSTQARIGGTYFVHAWDGDVAKEEGDLLGELHAPKEEGAQRSAPQPPRDCMTARSLLPSSFGASFSPPPAPR
jgi:hypothetical protein